MAALFLASRSKTTEEEGTLKNGTTPKYTFANITTSDRPKRHLEAATPRGTAASRPQKDLSAQSPPRRRGSGPRSGHGVFQKLESDIEPFLPLNYPLKQPQEFPDAKQALPTNATHITSDLFGGQVVSLLGFLLGATPPWPLGVSQKGQDHANVPSPRVAPIGLNQTM